MRDEQLSPPGARRPAPPGACGQSARPDGARRAPAGLAVTGIYRIGKQFEFQATRTRDGAPDGSGFLVDATLTASALTGPGFVVDFGELAPLKRYLDQTFDHRDLDGVLGAGRAGNTQVAMHLEAWCRAHLHEAAAGRLERVTVRCGRPAGPGPHDLAFSAQHRLGGLPGGHKCGRDHGHTYLVGPPPGQGALPDALRRLVAALDGSVLNEMLDAEPTSELLARHLLRSARSQGPPGSKRCACRRLRPAGRSTASRHDYRSHPGHGIDAHAVDRRDLRRHDSGQGAERRDASKQLVSGRSWASRAARVETDGT